MDREAGLGQSHQTPEPASPSALNKPAISEVFIVRLVDSNVFGRVHREHQHRGTRPPTGRAASLVRTLKGTSLGSTRSGPVTGLPSAVRSALAVLVLMNSGAALASGEKLKCAYTPKASVDRFVELFKRCAVREGEEIRIRKKHFEALDFGTTGLADIYVFGEGSYYVLPDGTKASVVAHEGGGPDRFSEGLVRTLVDGKIAYLSEKLEIVLVRGYDWGWQFDNGTALVCEGCRRETAGEHVAWVGGKWGYIDHEGKDVVPWQNTLGQARSKLEELANARAASSSDAL